jgi:hypothetical protein
MSNRISPNSVALAGEFAVLSQLALYGYDANMTLGRTKSVDILASDPKTDKFYQIEVKTKLDTRKNITDTETRLFGKIVSSWIMGEKHETIDRPNLWYCFVLIAEETKATRFFLVPNEVVSKYVQAQHQLWLKEEGKAHKDTQMRSFRIGLKGEKYKIPTPTADQYEDNWEFRKPIR